MNTLLQIQPWLSKTICCTLALALGARVWAVSPEEALATFELHPAFQIELVAAEPVVFDPVDLEFDEHGHAYVIEMPGYPFPEQEGRVVRLSDADNDGAYETRTVFAEGFPVASSILPFNGGILVASPPDLIFVKDTDGDGVADIRDTVMTGFSFGNTQHNYNGLTYGLDNWIHAGNGGNSGRVTWTDSNADPVSIRGVDFRFDLRTKQFETTGRTSGGFEIAFDKWGRNFQTHNLYHISQLVFPGKFIDALPSMSSGTLTLISDHEEGGLARIFPIGVQESRVNHPEQAGYFSGSCGITYYGGGAFPDGFNGNMFVCDVVLNLIHRDVLSPDGAALKASRGRDRAAFLASTDRSFRPVNMTTGPDGALYVLDMHRDAIEHPEWIPDELEADLDIDAGKDKGRIYRITPKGGLSLSNAVFKRDNLQSMVDTLSHPNKWWRDTAQRLLVEWEDEKVVPLLHNALDDSQSAVGRLHAMWTLQGLGALEYNDLAQALRDDDAGVRENALQIAADRTADSPQLRDSVLTLANDRDARVRLFAAIALQSTPSNDEVSDALATILDQDMDDPWTRMAVTAAAASDPNELMIRLIAKDSISNGDGSFVKLICRTAALNPTSGAWAALLEIIGDATDGPLLTAAFDGVATGFESHNRSIDDANPEIEGLIKRCMSDGSPALVAQALRVARVTGVDLASTQEDLIDEAMAIAQNQNAPTEARIQQLELVAFAPYKSRDDLLFDLLDTREPRTVQNAAIAQITDDGSIEDAKRLIAMWPTLGPDVRKSAGDYLLYRRANNALLLDALEDGRLKLGELNLHLERRRQLLWSRDKAVAQRSEKLFSDAGVVTRATAIDDMRPALSLTGNAELGKAIFQERCAECHRIGGDGFDVGPNLTDIFRKSPETLLHDILDPNAGAEPEYLAYTVEPTAEDLNAEIVSGLLVAETDDAITLRQAGGAETTFARSAIASFSTTGLSLMPEELEADLDHHAFADLLAYLLETR